MRSPIGLLLSAFAVWLVCLVMGATYLARGAEPTCSRDCACGCEGERPCNLCVSGLRWERHDGDQFDLIDRAGNQVGGWRVSERTYRARVAGGWSAPCPPPVEAPGCCRAGAENYGIDLAGDRRPAGWSVSGQRATEAEALAALAGGPAVPDDAGKPYVFWVGDPATGVRVKADAGDRARVQAVRPGHWMTQDREGRPMYTPGLWFVRADGTAVGHEAEYRGPDQLAEGLRRCAPDWKPDAVPDLSPAPSPLLPSLPALAAVPPAAGLGGALAGGGALAVLGLAARRWLRRPA